jgi:hypothetical protein
VSLADIKDLMVIGGVLVAAVGTVWNAWNGRRIERNTNSMSQRNEAIAEKLGVEKGKAKEKTNPS